ncbi:MAG TPA: tetratricopeptide repeat protein [Longimicrobium sp.]|nr:tetratricopeptide repeat protein [Longimicrobium sp.]
MTGKKLRDDLQRQIDAGNVVVIVGAGVSVGATNNQRAASWHGLLHHGVDSCVELPTSGLTEAHTKILHAQIDSGDLDMMLAAAEVVSSKLGAPKGGEWRRWLRETVGELKGEQREVIEALQDLGVTLATTNYDGLIEEVTGLQPVTWRDGAVVERVLRGEETGILHLHGHWKDPESVVLGVRDYEKVLGDAHAQTMQRAIRSLNTILFVGCGDGLADPNFGALLRWSESIFAGSEYRHFRLARDGEVAALQAGHPDEQRIFVLGYGPGHGDLAPFLRDLRPAAKDAASSTLAAIPVPAATLPPAPICFGRDAEIEELVATLLGDQPEPLPILGPAGIGKSTITLVALNDRRVAERYGTRRFFIRCDAARTREAFAAAIATALGIPVGPQVESALITELAAAPAALAIDNAETPWEGDTLRVEELFAQIAALPGLALIASLRGYSRPMGVRWRQPIQPLSLPLPDARKVFLAIAGDQFAGDPDLDRLLRALDGVPLAITLMANAAEGQPDLADTWARWETERTRMLKRAGGTDRLLNIEASYEISIQGPRMTDEARRLLSVFGILPGGVARGDLEAVLPDVGTRAATVLRQVGLAFYEADRLRLLAPLREYVHREHPPEADDLKVALSYYQELATSLASKPGDEGGAEAVARLTPEVENMEFAIMKSLDGPDSETAIQAAIHLATFIRFTGVGTTMPLEKAVLVAQSRQADDLAAQCFLCLGLIAFQRSDTGIAQTRFEEALALCNHIGDTGEEARCIEYLGDVARARSDHETARIRYEEALPLYRRAGNNFGEASCIECLGDIALAYSDNDTAKLFFAKALPLYRRVGSVVGEANCIFSLGGILVDSDHEAARTSYETALSLYKRVGSVLGEANCYSRLGEIAFERSDYETALIHYTAALPLYRRLEFIQGEANCLVGLGEIFRVRSDYETARARYEQALALYKRIPEPYSIGLANLRLAHVAADKSQRRLHVDAAKDAWHSIGRYDLVGVLLAEFDFT